MKTYMSILLAIFLALLMLLAPVETAVAIGLELARRAAKLFIFKN
jgi:hypothetical protein